MSRIEHGQRGGTNPAAKPFSWRQALFGGLASMGLIAAMACGGGSSSVPTPTPGATSGGQTRASQIKNFALESFTISAGTTVTWTNLDSAAHTSTSGISPNFDGAFDSSAISQNGTFSHRFNSSGAFPYFCSIHPSMTGIITVQ